MTDETAPQALARPAQAGQPAAAPADPAGSDSGLARPSTRGRPRPADLLIAVPVLAELVVGGYRLGGPSLWRDEGYTLSAATRPVSGIIALLHHTDAVHGAYYLVMHYVVAVLGTSAVALRLPSLLASSLAAGMTALLGRRLAREAGLPAPAATGMLAGLLLVALPQTTWYAQDARSYAFVTLCAVTAGYLLVLGHADGRWRWWAGYGAVIVLLGAASLFALLLVAAHGTTLLIARWPARQGTAPGKPGQPGQPGWPGGQPRPSRLAGRTEWRWLVATAVAIVILLPLITAAESQSKTLNWVTKPHLTAVTQLITGFAGTGTLVPIAVGAAALCVVMEFGPRRRACCTLAALALPWLVLPPAILLGVSLVHPAYESRYVVFCAPAMALLTAGGLSWLARVAARVAGRRRWLTAVPPVLIAAVVAAQLVVPQQDVRAASARPDNFGEVAAVVAAHERPGDAVLYLPWSASEVRLAYPAPFGKLRDIEQGKSPVASATLKGTAASAALLASRAHGLTRLWTVAWRSHDRPRNRSLGRVETDLLSRLRLVRTWKIKSIVLRLYQAPRG